MISSKRLFIGAFAALTLSCLVFAYSVYSNYVAQQELFRIAQEGLKAVRPALPASAPPTFYEQILTTRRDLQKASYEIGRLKSDISSHASNAANQRTIRAAQQLLNDISINSEKVVEQNRAIEARLMDLTSLYERKIEAIYKARSEGKEATFGLAFWVGLVGLVGSVSTMILAWRTDRRELIELEHKLRTKPAQVGNT
jgi:hypothetical protein